eukprot:6492614-Amphidinium_carterae.3
MDAQVWELLLFILRGADKIKHWRASINLDELICDPEYDHRSVGGLKKAIATLEKKNKPEHMVELTLLRNFKEQAEVAKALRDGGLATFDDGKLESMLTVMRDAEVKLPARVKCHLVERYCNKLVAKQCWKEMLCCINPFGEATWDEFEPSLSALASEGMDRVLAAFQSIFFTTTLVPMITGGQSTQVQLAGFLELANAELGGIDTYDVEDSMAAACLQEAKTIMAAVGALLAADVDPSCEAFFLLHPLCPTIMKG